MNLIPADSGCPSVRQAVSGVCKKLDEAKVTQSWQAWQPVEPLNELDDFSAVDLA
jgi:hypothetical protein